MNHFQLKASIIITLKLRSSLKDQEKIPQTIIGEHFKKEYKDETNVNAK